MSIEELEKRYPNVYAFIQSHENYSLKLSPTKIEIRFPWQPNKKMITIRKVELEMFEKQLGQK